MGYAQPATSQSYDNCGPGACWSRIKHYCICVRSAQRTGGVEASVVMCEDELRRIYHDSAILMSWREFADTAQAEADKAARESIPIIAQAQAALGQLPGEQALVSIRFCVRLGPIRICVEWLL